MTRVLLGLDSRSWLEAYAEQGRFRVERHSCVREPSVGHQVDVRVSRTVSRLDVAVREALADTEHDRHAATEILAARFAHFGVEVR